MLTSSQTDLASVAEGVDLVWAPMVTFLIFFMHVGFAMPEVGQARTKNVASQLTKNLLMWSIGVIVLFLLGTAVSSIIIALTNGSALDITGAFMNLYVPDTSATTARVDWLFGVVFAMTTAAIASGAVAGHARLRAHLTYTVLIANVIYPAVVGFTWGGGFLDALGFHSFADDMVVHGMGGIAGLTAVWAIGPRMDCLKPDGTANVIPGHSIMFAVLGTLTLTFGWYGFNAGTAAASLVYADDAVTLGSFVYVGRVAFVTTLGMAAGAIGAGGVAVYKTGKVDMLHVANGIPAGLVGITAIADDIVWPGALIVSLLVGAQLPVAFEFVEKRLRIDDVCAVFLVHGSAGVLGTLLYLVFAVPLWHDGASFASLVVPQVTGVGAIAIWTFVATAVVFDGFHALGQVRVSSNHERKSLNTVERGVDTYPKFGSPDHDIGIRTDSSGIPSGGEFMTTRREGQPMSDADAPNDGEIKMVMAVIRPDKFSDMKTALVEIGVPSFTVISVPGRGPQPAKKSQWRDEEYTVDLHQKVKIECTVADIPADDMVDAIADAVQTGEKSDEEVFALPVESAAQARIGRTGRDVV